MDMEEPSVSSSSLFSPEPDSTPIITTPVSNFTIPFPLTSLFSSVLCANSEVTDVNSTLLSSPLVTSPTKHSVNNEENSLLHNFLQSISMSSAFGLQQDNPLLDLTFPIVELPQNPHTEDVANSPASGTPDSSEPSSSPTHRANPTLSPASAFFGSPGLLQMMQKNISDSQLSGQISENSFELDIDDQRRQLNLSLPFAPPRASNEPSLSLRKPSNYLNMFNPSPLYPPEATMMFDQNSFCLPNVADLFGQQISAGQSLGQHNAAVAGLFAANGKGQNGKSGNEKPIDGRKNRRNRIAFSKFQLDELEKCFQSTPYPDVTTRDAVSKFIQLPEEKVQVWLKNRRSKYRKQSQNLAPDQSIRSRFGESRQNQKETPGKMWNPATIASFDGLLTPTFPTSVSSPAVFDVKNLFSAQSLQRSILENLMRTSQLASFSV
ncbi:homeobox domain-containing protein [Ditylenchus destructor]|uniref:Homeobox domain-containing protein n=1 Tax=Ditylenchus destructor TaxID=166010 RepID=A0AAD4MKB6_9BILA|nr:homeobox domain-containing protein [Ditylenchus destructor]